MKENALLQVRRGVGSVGLVMLGLLLGGCSKAFVIVDVPVKPEFIPPGSIREVDVHAFQGPQECAPELEKGVKARAVEDFTVTIPGLPDLEGPLEVDGTVEKCSMRMGYGVLNATMRLSHAGKPLYQKTVREESNRPGASTEEMQAALVKRVIDKFAAMFVSGKRGELREGRPLGSADPGWIAAKEKNWKLAIEFWSKHLAQNQNDARAWYNRGIAHEGLWEFKEAVADYKKASELERDDVYTQALVRAEKFLRDSIVINAAKKSRE
ncbi:MAG: tetratricopeptide repeat protein [Nitrospira sp.]|nr:tetratricopeptide repeat protein [Nitrospira sp.]